MAAKSKSTKTSNLGIETDIKGIKIEELLGNETALKMLINDYKNLETDNAMLKQDLQRQSTIQRALDNKKEDNKISSVLGILASIIVSFGINFVTTNMQDIKGWILVVVAVLLQGVSCYYSFRKENRNV